MPQIEQPIGAVHRNLEPETNDQQDDRRLDEADHDGRHRLADKDLHRRQRRHQQLIESALFALAGVKRRSKGTPDRRRRGTPFSDNMRSEEHTPELQSLMRISYAVFCLKKKTSKQ